MNKFKQAVSRGITMVEMLVALVILSLVICLIVPGLNGYFSHMEINDGLRAATSALQTARYRAIRHNKRIKLQFNKDRFLLLEKQGRYWKKFYEFKPVRNITLTMSAYPVFSPFGSVSPLCSIYVENQHRKYKISLSMAGRIKVIELKPPD